MNLAYNYPLIFWNIANLIVDSGAMNLSEEIETDEELKNSSTDYGKIATAIGKMKNSGINFSLPDINKSDLTFSPDLETNTILYGLRGITGIGNQIIKDILQNRPYNSIEDFISKVKVNKTQMSNLIKAGTFDSLYSNRVAVMKHYINIIADKKKRITLQNMQMLISKNLIPKEFDFERRLFNFNKYLKQFKKGDYYLIDETSWRFYSEYYNEELIKELNITTEKISGKIKQTVWDSIYKEGMNPIRDWMKKNQEQILSQLNNSLEEETLEKYAKGNISKWEMDSLSFYYHEHELSRLKKQLYQIEDYNKIPENDVKKIFTTKDGVEIPIYNTHRIAGTVIDKDKNKSLVTLLTDSGVVTVKIWKSQFGAWDKQISEKDMDGTKHVIEKSWFTRGTKIIVTGVKREECFIPKVYKDTPFPVFTKIIEMKDGVIIQSQSERVQVEEDEE